MIKNSFISILYCFFSLAVAADLPGDNDIKRRLSESVPIQSWQPLSTTGWTASTGFGVYTMNKKTLSVITPLAGTDPMASFLVASSVCTEIGTAVLPNATDRQLEMMTGVLIGASRLAEQQLRVSDEVGGFSFYAKFLSLGKGVALSCGVDI